MSSCITEKNEFGKCIGIGEDKDPKLTYKVSTTNVVIGIIFIELIFPPVLVVTDSFYCPTGVK
jgi:hypothetical protein